MDITSKWMILSLGIYYFPTFSLNKLSQNRFSLKYNAIDNRTAPSRSLQGMIAKLLLKLEFLKTVKIRLVA